MSDKELVEEARQEESIHDKLGDGFSEGSEERAFYYGHRDRYKRLADALEAATEELESIKPLFENLSREYPNECNKRVKAKAERDAALAAIERVRALHREEEHECVECSFESMPDVGFRGVSVPWPCPTVAALDGAPEPEWEYMSDQGAVTDSPESALDRRRKAGPWLPVEGEKR